MPATCDMAARVMLRGDRCYSRYLAAVRAHGLRSPEACGWWEQYERCGRAARYLLRRLDRVEL